MKENTKKTLEIYLRHMGKYKLWGLIVLFSVAGASGINAIIPIYYKKFFDVLGGGLDREKTVEALIAVLITILLIDLAGWLLWRATTFASSYFQSRIIADISNTCFKYLHKHSFSYFNNNFTGSLVKRVSYFTRSFEDIVDRTTWEFIPLIVNIAVIVIVLITRNLILGAIVIVWTILILTINWFMAKYKLKFDIARSEAQTKATGFLSDTITNNANVKLFGGYKKEVESFTELNEKIFKLRLFAWNLDNIFEAVQTLFIIALEVGIMYMGIRLWEVGKFTMGDFILLQSYIMIIVRHTWNFGRMIRHTYYNLADAEEMTVLLNTPHEIIDASKAKELKISGGKIEFKNVDFYYHQTRKVLQKFNLVISPGERVALIGPSGAGKTTVVKLLLRNHDVSGGKIFIDGQDISKVTQESLWKNLSLVPQDPILFHRTLMENIRYGKPEAMDEEVIKASKIAHAHEFITSFSQGYETYVGERGIKLSGGERQRVAIARAALRNAPILILDEATSSLDSQSEKLIQDALSKLMENKTVIVIAHRLSTIVKMDRIIFIDDGVIKEEGSHKELLAKEGGRYRKLWELQAGGFIAE